MDDSIVRVMAGRPMILRRARGFAPLPIQVRNAECGMRSEKSEIVLAVGAHLKNSVALAVGKNIFVSQHIGDLETEAANHAFQQVATDLPKLYETAPTIIAADLHPDYLSTQFAQGSGKKVVGVQHHVAHVLSCLTENEVALPALGVAWDGTGYGTDGTIWGGEFFRVTGNEVKRVAHFRPFRLPGGDKAVKEPRRVALGLLYELYGESAFELDHLPPLQAMPPVEMITLRGMLQRKFNSPLTSSVGRLFDAVASLVNLRQHTRFEGQAAMDLEFAIGDARTNAAYDIRLTPQPGKTALLLDWSPLIGGILHDQQASVTTEIISAKFHNALAEFIVALAKKSNEQRVALSGGCFQNRYLLERAVSRLRTEGFQPYWHQRVPTNDGGIALGQVVAALRENKSSIANPKS
jgi:hydrogenase maturation protein HypF